MAKYIIEEIENSTSEPGCGTIITIGLLAIICLCIVFIVEKCSGNDTKEDTKKVQTTQISPEQPVATASFDKKEQVQSANSYQKEGKEIIQTPSQERSTKVEVTTTIADTTSHKQNKAYSQYAHLYASEKEFKQWSDKGKKILEIDIEQRQTLHDFSIMMQDTKVTTVNLQKDVPLIKTLEKRYLSKLRGTLYYDSALKVLLFNKKFAKEWEKNGSYFSSLEDFYMAYTSPDYRQILRQQKKAQ